MRSQSANECQWPWTQCQLSESVEDADAAGGKAHEQNRWSLQLLMKCPAFTLTATFHASRPRVRVGRSIKIQVPELREATITGARPVLVLVLESAVKRTPTAGSVQRLRDAATAPLTAPTSRKQTALDHRVAWTFCRQVLPAVGLQPRVRQPVVVLP